MKATAAAAAGLALALSVVLAACGDDSSDFADDKSPAQTTERAKPKPMRRAFGRDVANCAP